MTTLIPGQQSASESRPTQASEPSAEISSVEFPQESVSKESAALNESNTTNENSAPDISAPVVTLQVHPWRSALYEELHNRPSPIIEGACQITHFTVMLGDASEALYEHIVDLCKRFSMPAPAADSSCLYLDFGGFELRWERHLEFANFTFICPNVEPFSADALSFIPKDWLAAIPGNVVVALHVALIEHEPTDEELHKWFEGQRWNGAKVAFERGAAWTAFKLHSDGFGRIVAHGNHLNPYQRGRLVQRLIEIETYRLMSLLGLPVARELNPAITQIEEDLAVLNQRIADIQNEDDERLLLTELSQLAANIEQHRSDTNFRFSATNAYYDLVGDRLHQLHESHMDGVQSLQEFLERRLSPGIKTCQSVRDRLEDLSRRIHRTTSLLRTRVELSIEAQNQNLLTSMNRRSHLQLRLQQTVEGLSVVAIGYYALSLMGYGFEALKAFGVPVNKDIATGIAMPIVLFSIYFGMHRIRTKLTKQSQKASGAKKSSKSKKTEKNK
ncbi:MAG: DUF3422 domain-containing protein [Oleispira antarctica]|uniref:Membrane-anchored protein n=1 Tax=Oleispira antarctica RB-8 TaxID=698738 RepID=R4YLB8_OLEAN|nr:DUF3422 domain-containing protein [Oleispira antarctica]MBQ0794007.1 DUF3422 domain-containing protein [Oleispira antarctica]CCK75486.1 conserved hypothetical protein [Oleispira antarctica RB-8]|tara:strand:+ start:2068 stop:3570 length:1503 start_codon:yes stop_codon:yes gene_type:complete